MNQVYKVLIGIPCFNEQDSISECIESLLVTKKQMLSFNTEIIVINDGSYDQTVNILKDYNDRIEVLNSINNYGLSEVFNSLMYFSKNNDIDYLVVFDSDRQYPSEDIPKMLQNAIENKADLTIGSRDFKNNKIFSKTKNFLQISGSYIVSKILDQTVSDATSGFRIYSKKAIDILFSNNEFTYTIETLFQIKSKKLFINEFKISKFSETRKSRLFNSNLEYLKKTFPIIIKSLLLYKTKTTIRLLSIILLVPGLIIISRFFIPYFTYGSNNGNTQSLIVGVGYLIMLFITVAYFSIRTDNFKNYSILKKALYKPKHTK